MAAAQLVSGLVAGGAPEKAIQPGTGVQNGHYQDESIPQALAASRRESLPACRSRLPADQPEISPGQCGYSHVCLPGAASPTELYVCMPEEEPDMTKAAAAVAAPQAAEAP